MLFFESQLFLGFFSNIFIFGGIFLKIGFFDSGIGGLTVLREADRVFCGAVLYYYGDNINAPYGLKGEDEIFSLVLPAFDMFSSVGVDAAVVACNTVTAACIKRLRERYSYIIIGMEPAVKPALLRYKTAAVLCTPATAKSEKFARLINGYEKRVKVFAPPRLAEDVEVNALFPERVNLARHFSPLDFSGADCAVLGCTHYSRVAQRIESYLSLPVIDGNRGTIIHLVKILNYKACKTKKPRNNEIIFLNTSKNYNSMVYDKILNEK